MNNFTAVKAREVANGYDRKEVLVKKFLKKIEDAARAGKYEVNIIGGVG